MINIIKKNLKFTSSLKKRTKTEECILHHRAGNGDVESIHKLHINNTWAGIGYHLYIRKDGSIYEGRPIDKVGAHATNHNSKSVGICFEGNFETETMSEVQKQAGIDACNYVRSLYPTIKFLKHKDVGKTACPGKNFPFSEIVNGKVENVPHGTKSIEEVAKEVIAGKFGNSPNRKANIEKAGYNYSEVQAKVNELLSGKKTTVKVNEYYPKCSSKYISITSALNSIGVDSSYNNRKKIALKNGIPTYKGTFTENVRLLAKLKAGKLIKI